MKLNYLKALSVQACNNLSQIPSEAMHVRRQRKCANFLRYAVDSDDLSMALNKANFCKQRSCPICCWLRSAKIRMRIFRGLPTLLQDYEGYHFLLLTLTVRNCNIGELRSTVRSMEQAWHRLVNLPGFPAIGSLKTVEVTRPYDCFYAGQFIGRMSSKVIKGLFKELEKTPLWNPLLWREYFCEEVHPHIHCMLMVSPSYFEPLEYIDHPRWCALWKRAARLNYTPVVDIRKIDHLDNAVFEVSKYCFKVSEMVDLLGCLAVRRLHGLRLFSVGGAFNDYFSQAALDAIEATAELGNEQFQEGVPLEYQWNGYKYDLIRLGQLEWELG